MVAFGAFAVLGVTCAYAGWVGRFQEATGAPRAIWWWPASLPLVLATALGAGWWVLAVASWMPRGLPALFVPLLFAAPHLVARGLLSPYGDPAVAEKWLVAEDAAWMLWTQAPLALAVAFVSIVRGRRWSGGPRASACVGAVATLLALLPAYVALGWRAWVWLAPPPANAVTRAGYACTGTNGRHVFQTLQRQDGWPMHAAALETATGKWIRLGGAASWVGDWRRAYEGVFPRIAESTEYVVLGTGDSPAALLDADTLELVRPLRDLGMDPELASLLRASFRRHGRLRLPDGRRLLVLGGQLEIEADGGGRAETIALPPRCHVFGAAGAGLVLSTRDGYLVYDLARKRVVTERPQGTPWISCLGQHWLVHPRTKGAVDTERWELLDPDSGQRTALPPELECARVVMAFADGRVLLAARPEPARTDVERLLLATLPDGPVEEVGLPEGFAAREGWRVGLAWDQTGGLAESGELLVQLHGSSSSATHVSTYRPGATRLGPARPVRRVVARLDADTLLVLSYDAGPLERLSLATGRRTPLGTAVRR